MVGTGLVVAGLSIWILYQASFDEVRLRLVDAVRSRAHVIGAIARYNKAHWNTDHAGNPDDATLGIIADAYRHYPGLGKTGEFVLARRDGQWITFLLHRQRDGADGPKAIAWRSDVAEPTRQALTGESGTLIGHDYRGALVLAAYAPISPLDAGIVAKVDLSEIRAPFVKAGVISLLGAVLVMLIGGLLFRRVSAPILEAERNAAALAESESRMLTYFNSCPWGITITDTEGRYLFVNEAFQRSLGISQDDILGKTVFVHRSRKVAETARAHEKRVLETGMTISEIRKTDPAATVMIGDTLRRSFRFSMWTARSLASGPMSPISAICDAPKSRCSSAKPALPPSSTTCPMASA